MICIKTWEVIKALADKPELTFKNLRFGGVLGYEANGALSWLSNTDKNGEAFTIHHISGGDPTYNGNWNDDWELVRKPVPWQEAIQAWVEGKTIKIITEGLDDCIFGLKHNTFQTFQDQHGWTFNKLKITKGKWYIED